jgi:hypothetical protein
MKKFFIKLAIFLIPFPLYLGIVMLIDPYNYLNVSHLISPETKLATSAKFNPQLWKLIEFKHIKADIIIFGDSRSAQVNAEHLKQTTGFNFYNFSYAGGTLIDMIETFWYAAEKQNLKEAYFGINFNLYNDFERNNGVEQARSIMKNIFSYSFSKVVFKSMIQNIKKQYFVKDYTIGEPDMNREEFWSYQLHSMGIRFYQKYKHPDQYLDQLSEISDYCKKNNIKLVFFMPPTHVDLQKRIADFKLEKDYDRFISDISTLGKFYNLDVASKYTQNRNNFNDPFHPVNDSLIVNSIWIRN